MARPALLRNLTHRVLWTVTLTGTVAFGVYWIAMREPEADWRILVMGLLLSIALGWWPPIAAATGAVFAVLSWFFMPVEDGNRWQICEEVIVFTALGLGWGLLLRDLLQPKRPIPAHRPASDSLRHDIPSLRTPPEAFRPAAEQAVPPPAVPLAPPAAPPAMRPVAAPPSTHPSSVFEPSTDEGVILPKLGSQASPQPLPQRPPASAPPATALVPSPESIEILPDSLLQSPKVVPQAAPLMTQEVDLGDFRAFVASQQAASSVPAEALPVNRVAGRAVDARPSQAPAPPSDHSSIGGSSIGEPSSAAAEANRRRSQAVLRAETTPGTPYETILEWYNQFSWAPWQADELEKRYYRIGQKISWDVLALQDLVRAWKVWKAGATPSSDPAPAECTSLYDLEGFLRCEGLGVLRSRGLPDLNLLSREDRSDAWMAVYRETRGRVRGGSPVLRPMADNLVAFDPAHTLSGRPDALVDVSGECDVVSFVTPMSAGEPMAWTGVYAEAQRQLAEQLGVVVTEVPIVVTLCMPFWDERRQPRLHEIEDRATEERRLAVVLERFRRVKDGSAAVRPQTHGSICNGCGMRHFCPSYAGSRPRLDLANPPPLLRKFLQ